MPLLRLVNTTDRPSGDALAMKSFWSWTFVRSSSSGRTSNGTATGPIPLSKNASGIRAFIAANGKVFFAASDYRGLELWVTDGTGVYEATWTDRSGSATPPPKVGDRFDLIYAAKVRSYNGIQTLSLDVRNILPV